MSGGRLPGWIAALLALAGPLAAQQYTHLSGLVLDVSGAGIPDAAVSVINEDTGFRRLTESHPDGGYVVSSLQPGVYKITVRKAGFRSMIRFGVRLEVSEPARVDFTLPVGSMQEAITVEGTAPLLNSADASVGTLVLRDEIEHLPLNGRGLLSLLELAPGTIVTPATRGEPGQFTVNGQRPNTHYFTVDGASANTGVSAGGVPAQSTGGTLPGMTAIGSLHSLVSLDALEEFRAQTSTVIPEFGRMPGAQVSLSSRSGSNEWHGGLLYFFRNEDLDANDWFANRHGDGRAPLRLADFGASLGGPVWRNRTFFFLAYEGMRMRQPSAWREPVPSLAVRRSAPAWAQPLLNLFPAPNGPALGGDMAEWTGRNTRPSRLDVGSLRIDHALTSRITAFGRYNDAPSANEFGGAEVSRLNLRSRSLTLGLNVRVNASLVLDTRANSSRANASSNWTPLDAGALSPCYLGPITLRVLRVSGVCNELVRFSFSGAGDLVIGPEGDRAQSQYQFFQTANWNRGAHSLRVGLDYLRLSPLRRDATGTMSIIAASLDDLGDNGNLWTGSAAPQRTSSVLKEISLFAQDTWRASSRLSLTYGVRWEFSNTARPNQDVYYLNPLQGIVMPDRRAIWPETSRNFAPRLGIAYRPSAAGRTVIRAGAGVYYDSSLSIATDLINGGPFSVWQFSNAKFAPFSMLLSYGFVPDLRLPLVTNWSAAVEHAFGRHEVASISYVGSAGHDLLRREMGGPGSSERTWVALATNHGRSQYHGLQVEYRRPLVSGIEGRVSYAWAHSIDNSSTDALLHWVGSGLTARQDRGSSDFDVRQALTAAFTYEIPGGAAGGRAAGLLRDWALDGIFRARTGFPITVLDDEHYMAVSFADVFRPNLVGGLPVWIGDTSAPGGRRLNPATFQPAASGVQGNLGRNAIAGFGMSQLDLALRREFPFGERQSLELRVEAFNFLNQANFADPAPYLIHPLFGQSLSMLNLMLGTGSPGSGLAPMFQTGGARSVQVALRFRF